MQNYLDFLSKVFTRVGIFLHAGKIHNIIDQTQSKGLKKEIKSDSKLCEMI